MNPKTSAHEEDIFDMKKIQANLVTQIEDLEIGASSLNKMISFLRDNQRGSTSPNGKFGPQVFTGFRLTALITPLISTVDFWTFY